MAFELPDLPYAKDALAPHMSAETLEFHHGKHHAAYVKKTNQMLLDEPISAGSLVEVVRAARQSGNSKLFNNAAQLWNHSFFWQCLAPAQGQQPDGKLKQMIDESFGSADAMLKKLADEAANHFSNGWAWLVKDGDKLAITNTMNAGNPMTEGKTPLLTLDVWEHAYYIDYRNARPNFISAFLDHLVHWDFAAANLRAAK